MAVPRSPQAVKLCPDESMSRDTDSKTRELQAREDGRMRGQLLGDGKCREQVPSAQAAEFQR